MDFIENRHEPLVVDNRVISSKESLDRVTQITGIPIEFHEFDVCDEDRLTQLLTEKPCEVTIHFAGLKVV